MAETDRGESLQVRAPAIVAGIAALLAMLAAVAFGFTLLFSNRIGTSFVPAQVFPLPGAVSDERARRLSLQQRQQRELAGANGRIPIEKAMAAIVARGGRAFDPP